MFVGTPARPLGDLGGECVSVTPAEGDLVGG